MQLKYFVLCKWKPPSRLLKRLQILLPDEIQKKCWCKRFSRVNKDAEICYSHLLSIIIIIIYFVSSLSKLYLITLFNFTLLTFWNIKSYIILNNEVIKIIKAYSNWWYKLYEFLSISSDRWTIWNFYVFLTSFSIIY